MYFHIFLQTVDIHALGLLIMIRFICNMSDLAWLRECVTVISEGVEDEGENKTRVGGQTVIHPRFI